MGVWFSQISNMCPTSLIIRDSLKIPGFALEAWNSEGFANISHQGSL